MRKRRIFEAAFLISVVLAGCSSKSSNEKTTSISVGESAELSTVDISLAMDNTSSDVAEQVDEGLYDFTKSGGLKPALATNMPKITDKGTTYTFNLRHNAKWSNGDPVTAQDFVYSWQRTVNPKTKSQQSYYFDGVKNYTAISSGKMSPSKLGIKAIGKYKLVVKLDHAMPYFKSVLAVSATFPQNKKVVTKLGSKYGTSAKNSVYNGAYVLKGWTGTNDTWTYAKNNKYWDKKNVKLSKVHVKVIKAQQTGVYQFKDNKLQMVPISGSQVKAESNNKSLYVRKIPGTMYLQYNMKDKLMKNEKIRQALTLSFNSSQLVNKILQDKSQASTGYVPTGFMMNGEDFAKKAGNLTKTDNEKAKKLFETGLKELGLKKASFTILSSNDDATKSTTQFLQAEFEKNLPGLKVELKAVPFNSRLTESEKGQFQAVLSGWTPVYADPTDFLNLFTTTNSNNFGKWSNSEYDKLVKKANTTYALQPKKREIALQKANKIVTKDAAMTPVYFLSEVYLVNSHLKGLMMGPLGQPYFKDAYME